MFVSLSYVIVCWFALREQCQCVFFSDCSDFLKFYPILFIYQGYSESKVNDSNLTASQKRRIRRRKLQAALNKSENKDINPQTFKIWDNPEGKIIEQSEVLTIFKSKVDAKDIKIKKAQGNIVMEKTRDEVLAAREAKKLAKLKGKVKLANDKTATPNNEVKKDAVVKETKKPITKQNVETPEKGPQANTESSKGQDEVDKAVLKTTEAQVSDKSKDLIKAERAAKKAAKQAKKKGDESGDKAISEMTVKDVAETLKDIANVAKGVQDITDKVQAIHLDTKKEKPALEETGKSKAELRAERRAKQEAQRAAKIAAEQKAKPKDAPVKAVKVEDVVAKRESTPTKAKSVERTKPKAVSRVNWFQHLVTDHDTESLKKVPLNSNLHPAVIKLGVQLATKVVTGSNARCIALLDALRKLVTDYTLPAKTEYARGLESQLAASLEYLWSMRQPCAAQTNAVKYFRHQLTQLPNNVPEYDAKKKLQDLIDNYIHDQIDTAGEAISMAVRNKIMPGDTILTYGCSSLIERILCEAWAAKPQFRTVVAGRRAGAGRELLRRLAARGLPCTYCDITAVSFLMNNINKVLLGASSLLANGSVLGAVGSAQVALVAREKNVPVLVACETHKFSERVQTDAFVYNEIGNPDDLIDKSDDNSPLKDWRSNPNLTLLNLTYDVTPANLVTAVVTELAILPCTSAPVVLRTKLAEHGV
ncbi:translation initiation factor eIF-2B subunit delta isoform X1 [Amyelois transitella]|uniref:translation initiation factor eIF-2B subunit delta isoform X1 n=1 Tax=Amyelois transitella TaxID=680683 RepID=UPI00298F7489|nr:translation initiation factor eIF-2B subunit delta isoform X1 [Amyelois transitella]